MATRPVPGYSRASELFQLLRTGEPMTRSELTDTTGLSRTTVGSRVDQLVQAGLAIAVDEPAPSGGRPSTQFSFNPLGRVVLAFDIRSDHTAVAVTDLRGAVLQRRERPIMNSEGPAAVLACAVEMARSILDERGLPENLVAGIGIALAGYAEIFTGRLHTLPYLHEWTGDEIERQLRDFLPVPIIVDNDVNMMAVGEHLSHRGVDDMIFVRTAAGIGAGVIAGGHLQRGATSMAGNIGHSRVPRNHGIVCRCGNVGCLDASASHRALSNMLIERGLEARTVSQIVALVGEKKPDAMQIARQAARDLGSVLAIYASILNPSIIAISDPIAETEDRLFAEIRSVVLSQASPMVADALQVVRAKPTETTAVTGASHVVIDHVLSPVGIEQLLASTSPERVAVPGG